MERTGAARDLDRFVSPKGRTPRLVLDLIRASGPISRIELAEATTLTPATITNVVRDLISAGLVSEVGTGEPTGGKRRTLLQITPDAHFAVGVLLGFDSISYVVVNLWGAVIGERDAVGAGDDSPADAVDRIARDIDDLVDELAIDRALLLGIGMVVPGPIDPAQGIAVQLPSAPPWQDFSVRDALERASGLPVLMENDATAAAMGEYWSGGTAGVSTFAVVHMGLGIGAGIVVAGEPVRGVSSNAGEIGHVSIDMDGPLCHCGNRGCLELAAAPAAAEQRYAERAGTALEWSAIAELAVEGDPVALDVVRESAEALATAVTSMANLLDLELIVFTGDGFGAAVDLMAGITQERLDRTFFSRRSHPVTVRPSANLRHAAALGGATLVLREHLTR